MTQNDIIGTGVAFPLRVDQSGAIALSSGVADVEEAIMLILATAPGERPMRPEFGCGIHNFVFESIDASVFGKIEHEIRDALDRWEPRIDVLDVDIVPWEARADVVDLMPEAAEPERRAAHVIDVNVLSPADGVLLIDIAYVLRATNDVRNLVYPFYVIPAEAE
jgi:phage baseplate assembly protein W